MNLTTITEPPFEPVTLEEVYLTLRLDPVGSPPTHPLDAELSRQITTARLDVEAQTRRALIEQTVRLSVASFTAFDPDVNMIRLQRPPLIGVESVQYYDSANALQTVDTADYYITDSQVPEVRFVSGFSEPTLYDRPDAVRVTYTVGYIGIGSPPGTQEDYADAVPKALKEAVLIGVQMMQPYTSQQDVELFTKMQRHLIYPHVVLL